MTALEKDVAVVRDEPGNQKAEILRRLMLEPHVLASERRGLPMAAGQRLVALLRDIDEMVLPRVLCLNDGTRAVARLTISHRRLISVELPGRAAVVSGNTGLPELLAARLIDVVETRARLSLTVTRRLTVPKHAEPACSVATLRKALSGATVHGAFDRQMRHATAICHARLLFSDPNQPVYFTGAAEWAEPLKSLISDYRAADRGGAVASRMIPVRTQGVAIPLDDALIVVIASLDSRGFAVVLPRKAGLDLVEAWPFY